MSSEQSNTKCWQCGGAGIDGFDGTECNICHGSGRVPEDVAEGRSILENQALQRESCS